MEDLLRDNVEHTDVKHMDKRRYNLVYVKITSF